MFGRNRDLSKERRESQQAMSPISIGSGGGEDRSNYDKNPIVQTNTYVATMNTNAASSSSIRLEAINQSNAPNGRDPSLPSKPPLTRLPSVRTKYMEMLLHLDDISSTYNLLASLFTWVILAGFLVVPGTFTTFKRTQAFQDLNDDDSNEVAHTIVHTVANIGLLWLSGAFCVLGGLGCLWLWFRWRQNYIWLINRIFLPVTLNSVAGLITTLVNVYTAQKGIWSVTAKITAIVTGSCVGGAGFFFAIYHFWALRRVREAHERDMRLDDQVDEALADKPRGRANKSPAAPGSVV
ncbi:hypothetical protein A1O3_07026 [Capronia epimyces CBS 606.96]|uniref:Uncharacterized protein n=1 Tax=Capronia epimyces CBS 606.96 TaxID=1182542 RepID=W9XJP8_9EURO|nr:uncharacterized protein A1O3_07026 [Capronia epimyces CBS 606.96]EXJ80742.1 hypothetical protein A1O3_07026 [Capronia epimyces CBS 606.96]